MSNRSSVFAVCLIGLIVSIPLYHFKSKSLRSQGLTSVEETPVKFQSLTVDSSVYPTIESVLQRAESELKVIYGAEIVDAEKPLLVSLENNIWTVVGSSKDGGKGGVSEIKINKITGKIVHLSHGK